MVIRELVDGLDKEISAHNQAVKRLREMRERILSCCRERPPEPAAGDEAEPEVLPWRGRKRRAA